MVKAKIQGRSTPFGAKKGGSQLQSKNIIGTLAYKLCLYSLCFIRYMASLYRKLCRGGRGPWVTFVDSFVLIMYDLEGWWSMTLQNRGR